MRTSSPFRTNCSFFAKTIILYLFKIKYRENGKVTSTKTRQLSEVSHKNKTLDVRLEDRPLYQTEEEEREGREGNGSEGRSGSLQTVMVAACETDNHDSRSRTGCSATQVHGLQEI